MSQSIHLCDLPPDELEYHLAEFRERGQGHYLNPLLERLRLAQGTVFVDVGCGSGYVNRYVGQLWSLSQNVGLDFDLEALRLAKELNSDSPGVAWVCASGESLPLAKESADVLVSRVVLPYTRVESFVAEVSRCLKPGGRALFVLHPWELYAKWFSVNPLHWKKTAAGLLHFGLGLWFNLTGQLVRISFRGRVFGETWQTVWRMRRVFLKYELEILGVVRRPEFLVYVVKNA